MKIIIKRIGIMVVIVLAAFSTLIQAQNIESVIKNHLKAVNQEKLSKIKTRSIKGVFYQSGVEVGLLINQKRGFKIKQVFTYNENTHTVVFNKDKGWELNQFAGHTEPQELIGEQITSTKISSDIDSKIATYLKLKATYELGDTETIEGEKYYVIKFNIPNYGEEHVWIDTSDYTIMKSKDIKTGIVKYYSNYKKIDGILIPFETMVKLPKGEVKIIFSEIKFGIELGDDLFKV